METMENCENPLVHHHFPDESCHKSWFLPHSWRNMLDLQVSSSSGITVSTAQVERSNSSAPCCGFRLSEFSKRGICRFSGPGTREMTILDMSPTIWGFPKMGGYPQIIHFNRIFQYKASIGGTPILGNPHSLLMGQSFKDVSEIRMTRLVHS
jgi:hypothetical protein